ncbi:MAG: hypothetical protein H6736_12670 [Alphaproteobacteria bacterium]|nr:hypothetical protein [Alphaproteobacteria bacterium]MCB9692656.1 hypothetical protein [Alphaproteobacteria bacterium]
MIALLTLLTQPSLATDRDGHPVGLGLVVGQPTGVTGKVYLDRRAQAVDFAVASTPWAGLYSHVTYLWHPSVIASSGNLDVEWHVGVGGLLWTGDVFPGDPHPWADGDDLALGVRAPIGLDFNLADPRFQFFGDAALVAIAVPHVHPGIDASIGARYYF